MSKYLERLKALVQEKPPESPLSKGSKVLSVVFSEPSKPSKGTFESFESRLDSVLVRNDVGVAAPGDSPSTPPAPPAVVASLEERRAAVERLLDAMSAETERRRDWWREPPKGWREGRLELRSALSSEATIIRFKPKIGGE